MDSSGEEFSLEKLVFNCKTHLAYIESIYLLKDTSEYFTIAVCWYQSNNKHFKMFKGQNKSDIRLFTESLFNKELGYYRLIIEWLDSSHIPLKVKTDGENFRR